MSELGQWLRETRENKKLSLEQVEETTRIRRKFLQALEAGDYAALPTPVHVKGFLRNYAQYLGLDVDEVLARYEDETQEEEAPSEPGLFRPADISLSPVTWLRLDRVFAILLILAVVAVGAWAARQYLWPQMPRWSFTLPWQATPAITPVAEATSTPETSPEPTSTPSPTSAQTATPSPTPTPGPTRVTSEVALEVTIVERAWLLVEVDGVKVHEGIMEVGTSQSWRGENSIYLRCGNAGGVEATVNGEPLGTLGERGEVVDLYWGPQGQITPTPVITPAAAETITVTQSPTETVTVTDTPELTGTPEAAGDEGNDEAESEITASPQPTEATVSP